MSGNLDSYETRSSRLPQIEPHSPPHFIPFRSEVSSKTDSSFDPRIEVNAIHLRHNVSEVSRLVGNRPILAVIKNNRYGLGLTNVARIMEPLESIAGFAVVKFQEAVGLRDDGIHKPILLMGRFDEKELEETVRRGITPMIKGRMKIVSIVTFLLFSGLPPSAFGQGQVNEDKFSTWLPYQAIPNLVLLSSSPSSAFGFEWELTPLLYSFGMNKQISPWYSLIVEPTARFSGSIELSVAGQTYTSKVATSYFSYSARLMGYIPLIERGEHLALNIGVAVCRFSGLTRVFKVIGLSTIFGILHVNVKQSPNPSTWVTSLEFRIF